jgi:hypothetical protein
MSPWWVIAKDWYWPLDFSESGNGTFGAAAPADAIKATINSPT